MKIEAQVPNGRPWVSGGFAVSDTKSFDRKPEDIWRMSCPPADPNETACIWTKTPHTAYTVDTVGICSFEPGQYVVRSPNENEEIEFY